MSPTRRQFMTVMLASGAGLGLLGCARPAIAPTAPPTADSAPPRPPAAPSRTQPGPVATPAASPSPLASAAGPVAASSSPSSQPVPPLARSSPTPEPTPSPTQPTPSPAARASSTPEPSPPAASPASILLGIDVLVGQQASLLEGQRLGLVTNHTGLDRHGRSTIDVLRDRYGPALVALFGPEHGIRGDVEAGDHVASNVDRQTGLPIHSLYGSTQRPTAAMLQDLDALLYDIQDVGARPYTYIATLLEVMRAAASHGKRVVVLDRPNPIGGEHVHGNVLDPRFTSFVGPAPIAMRYGLTVGELARYFNTVLQVGADLAIVPMQGWQRAHWYDQTGLAWVNPSPNLRSLAAATLYPGTVLFEGTNLSEGRGTETPFEWAGAPWIDAPAWADALNGRPDLTGVQFEPRAYTPQSSKFSGQPCQGLHVRILDRTRLDPVHVGVAMLAAARSVAPNRFQFIAPTFDGLAGTDRIRTALQSGQSATEIVHAWQPQLKDFRQNRQPHLLYA